MKTRKTRSTQKEYAPGFAFVGQAAEVFTFNAQEDQKEALRQIQSLMTMDAQSLLYYGTALGQQLESQPSETMSMMLVLTRALWLQKHEVSETGELTQLPGTVVPAPSLVEKAKEVSRETLTETLGKVESVKGWNGEIPDGTFTVVMPSGDYRTLKIRTQAPDASFKPGARIISFLNGPDNWRNYQGFGEVLPGNQLKVWRKHESATTIITCAALLLAGPEAMLDGLRAYGKQSGSCGICGRKLTTPESLERGIGPDCAEKLGL